MLIRSTVHHRSVISHNVAQEGTNTPGHRVTLMLPFVVSSSTRLSAPLRLPVGMTYSQVICRFFLDFVYRHTVFRPITTTLLESFLGLLNRPMWPHVTRQNARRRGDPNKNIHSHPDSTEPIDASLFICRTAMLNHAVHTSP